MSKFLDDLLGDLANEPENETADEVENETVEQVEDDQPEVEDNEEQEGGTEEVAETDEAEGAPDVENVEEDDETELTPVERKAWGRLKALQDERTKRQAAEADRDRLNEQLAQMQRQQREAAAKNLPDAYEDPQGYIAAREAQFQEELTRQALGNSINRAVEKYGETEVEEAARWFEDQIANNPHIPLRQNMLSQRDQMEYVLSSYKHAKKVESLASGDYSGIVAELQKQGYQISKAQPTVAAPVATVTPTVAATTTAPAQTAPAAPKRSKLAGVASATTTSSDNHSMMDAILRR